MNSHTASLEAHVELVTISVPRRVREPVDAHALAPGATLSTALHPAALLIGAGAYVAMIAVFWLGFVGPEQLAIAMAVNTVTLVAFIGVPAIMAKSGKVLRNTTGLSFGEFLKGNFDTYTGPMPAKGAVILVVLVPICLALCGVALAIIYRVLQ